ncbi:hypothetical protein BH24ACI3_BH24ACI3_06670 [soil metagenome]
MIIAAIVVCICFGFLEADGQRRDYMTDEEIELVRDNQEMDLRMAVLVKMIDRRFAALNIGVGTSQEKIRKSEEWGPPPTGTRLQLLTDIRELLRKASEDLDLAVDRDADALKPETKSGKMFGDGVRKLEHAAKRYLPALQQVAEKPESEAERGQLLNAAELCEEIIAAAQRLPAPVKK